MVEYRLRRAGVDDARAIAEINAAAWRETYAALMPAEVLAGLDVDDWTLGWRKTLGAGDDAQAIFIALEEDAPIGFARCRRQCNPKLAPIGFEGEIASIYLMRRAQGRGLGRRLMARLAEHLIAHGCSSAAVWVLRDAVQARGFYEALGGAPVGVEGVWETCGLVLPDIAYGWRDLRALAALSTSAGSP